MYVFSFLVRQFCSVTCRDTGSISVHPIGACSHNSFAVYRKWQFLEVNTLENITFIFVLHLTCFPNMISMYLSLMQNTTFLDPKKSGELCNLAFGDIFIVQYIQIKSMKLWLVKTYMHLHVSICLTCNWLPQVSSNKLLEKESCIIYTHLQWLLSQFSKQSHLALSPYSSIQTERL